MPYTTDIDSHYQPRLAKGLDYQLLNAFLPEQRGWRRVQANKRHEDLFGDVVLAGHFYYVRQAGPGFADALKASQPSMDRLLVATFFENLGMKQVAEAEIARREAALTQGAREAVELVQAAKAAGRWDTPGE